MFERDKILILPTFVSGILSVISAALLCVILHRRANQLKRDCVELFSSDLDLAYRRLLLLHYLTYLSAFECLFALWLVCNFGGIVVRPISVLRSNFVMCKLIAVLNQFSAEGTNLFHCLIAIAIMNTIEVGFNWQCCDRWLCRRLYPKSIESNRQCYTVFRHQFGLTMAIVALLVILPIQNYASQRVTDRECRVSGTAYEIIAFIPLSVGLILTLISMLCVWRQHCCRRTNAIANQPSRGESESEQSSVIVGKSFTVRVTLFVLTSWLSWGWILGPRAYMWIHNDKLPPLWVLCCHHYSMALRGVFTFLVWVCYNPTAYYTRVQVSMTDVSHATGGNLGPLSTIDQPTDTLIPTCNLTGYGSCAE